jgi:hypothetical protein
MSLGSNSFPERRGRGGERGGSGRRRREARSDRCFSGLELRIGSGSLKDMDPGRLKLQIRKWAKAVVAYARQISFGSQRSRSASSSPTPSAAKSKSSLGTATPT